MPGFAFGGHEFRIVADTALFWPLRRALIVADLHLEKASWFAERGQMLPPYDSLATLQALAASIDKTDAREVWCLGDNFHDSDGFGRMAPASVQLLAQLAVSVEWNWIIGNHDPSLDGKVPGTLLDEATIHGLILRHAAEQSEARPELSGHYHPKVRATARGRSVTRPCFVRSETKLILPAFGAFTGGLDVRDPAIRDVAGVRANALLAASGRLVTLPIG